MQTQEFLAVPNALVDQADVLILPVPYEHTVTYQGGTAGGPEAILAASGQLEFYEEDQRWCPLEYLKLAVLPAFAAPDNESEQAWHERLQQQVTDLPRQNLFIGLGGEHSITPAMLMARMPNGGTVVQIDAHADLRPDYHGSIYNHACPMYRLRQHGYELIQIGIRSLHANEAALIDSDAGIHTWFDRQLQQPQQWQQLLDQLAGLSGPIWLTIDMDGFDPGLIASVGTPQPGGLSWHQGLDVLQTLFANPALDWCGVDILELVPEATRVSDMMAAKLVQKIMSYWGKAQGYDKRDKHGSQIGVDDD
ncbi:MAG: agmatinase [Chromatiales bacterium]|jgi:agmatinase